MKPAPLPNLAPLAPPVPTEFEKVINASADGNGEGPVNSAILRPVTIGANVKKPELLAVRDMSYVMDCVRRGMPEGKDLRAQFALIRAALDPNFKKGLKSQLPYFLGSLCSKRRANENVKFAWYAIFDIDHVPDADAAKRLIADKVPFARYVFRSVTDGVKLVVEFHKAVTNQEVFRKLYAHLKDRVEALTGLACDATPDWARACYFSFDPDLLSQPQAERIVAEKALAEYELRQRFTPREVPSGQVSSPANRASRPGPSSQNSFRRPDLEEARHIVQGLAKLRVYYDDWIVVGFALYNAFGESGRDVWLEFYANPHYRDTQHDLLRKWASFRSADGRANYDSLYRIGRDYGVI